MDANTSYLNEHLAAEEKDFARQEIEYRVNDLMRKGEPYYPWAPDNIREAIMETTSADMLYIAAGLGAAIIDLNLDNPNGNQMALLFIRNAITDYWKKQAMSEALKGGLI